MTNTAENSKTAGVVEESAVQPARKAWAAPVVIVSSVARNTMAKNNYFGFESHTSSSYAVS